MHDREQPRKGGSMSCWLCYGRSGWAATFAAASLFSQSAFRRQAALSQTCSAWLSSRYCGGSAQMVSAQRTTGAASCPRRRDAQIGVRREERPGALNPSLDLRPSAYCQQPLEPAHRQRPGQQAYLAETVCSTRLWCLLDTIKTLHCLSLGTLNLKHAKVLEIDVRCLPADR
jgi:hypothetical protein